MKSIRIKVLSKIVLFSFLTFTVHSQSQGIYNWDGCYQLYRPGVMAASFCLNGTNEEGIGGSNARMVIFGPNSDNISACSNSSAIDFSNNSFAFIMGAKKELILSEAVVLQGRIEGKATFGNTVFNFVQLRLSSQQHLLGKYFSEPRCRNLSAGQLVKF